MPKVVSDHEYFRAVRELCERDGYEGATTAEVTERMNASRRTVESNLTRLHQNDHLERGTRVDLSVGDHPNIYIVAEIEQPVASDDRVWKSANPASGSRGKYHLRPDCQAMIKVKHLVRKPRRLLFDEYELCKCCSGEIDKSSYEQERDCPYEDCDDDVTNLPTHLRHEHGGIGGDR
jgi:hypothetical protein